MVGGELQNSSADYAKLDQPLARVTFSPKRSPIQGDGFDSIVYCETDGVRYRRSVTLGFPDPEFAEPFRAYLNYFEDVADTVGRLYGLNESLASGVHDGVAAHPPIRRIERRVHGPSRSAKLETAFRKSWGTLRRLDREVEDPELFDEEANAWIPAQAYYAVYHAILGFAAASAQPIPGKHSAALRLAGKEVVRGALPAPWDAWCDGCPHTESQHFGGLMPSGDPVHVLSSLDPLASDDRFAMLLRTTRSKELDRRFAEQRQRSVRPGRTRRNISRAEKERIAERMPPTTLFDVLWRVRKKANYEDADTFVLGAGDEIDARRLAQALVTVTDGTVAALEALSVAYVGPAVLANAAQAYATKTKSGPESAVGRRAASWKRR